MLMRFPGKIDRELFTDSIVNLKHQFHKEQDTGKDTKFPLIYVLTSIFSTFIKEEPIHPVGSEFPGNLKIYEENDIFYCPVKMPKRTILKRSASFAWPNNPQTYDF